MVTAGVFMVCRLSPMFEQSATAMHVVTWVGAATCIFAATVGCAQNDIKRVIAYSTCSQLGYMFFAAGVGAYGAAMFHLFTHAFFKALLFLGAGSVIHAMHHEQDMRYYGARAGHGRFLDRSARGAANQFLFVAADLPDLLRRAALGCLGTYPACDPRRARDLGRRAWRQCA
jgi:NADH:ubiquinone oxidoreductase subunit 2 (subunit N)